MIGRRGFILAVVLAALVLLSMSVALGAQQALARLRESELATATASLEAAALSARVAALEAPVDSSGCAPFAPGTLLGRGEGEAGAARWRWQMTGVIAPDALLEVTVEQSIRGGVARAGYRLGIRWVTDSTGGGHWQPADGASWVRLPLS